MDALATSTLHACIDAAFLRRSCARSPPALVSASVGVGTAAACLHWLSAVWLWQCTAHGRGVSAAPSSTGLDLKF